METRETQQQLICRGYKEHYGRVLSYISTRISVKEDAENLAQDVWLHLLEYDREINADTLVSLLYTVASNIVNDYLRRLYRTRAVVTDMADVSMVGDNDSESAIVARDIRRIERQRVDNLPPQRRAIYIRSRYYDQSVSEIAREMSLSLRTVENHLRMGRRDIRTYMADAI